jgi:hypothetical protein
MSSFISGDIGFIGNNVTTSTLSAIDSTGVKIRTNNTERVRIDNAGNVGIGTSSPQNFGSGYKTLQLTSTGSGATGGSVFSVQDSASVEGRFQTYNGAVLLAAVGATVPLTFVTNLNERMRIDASGNVGIGTTSTADQKVFISTGAQWSANNIGANLVVGGSRNNGIGLLDSSNANPWAIANVGGALVFNQMPALGNTASGLTERAKIAADGSLFVGYTSGGAASPGGVVKAKGYNTKAGSSAGLGSNVFNIGWSSPTASLFIDDTNLGSIQVTSDYRIKRNVQAQTATAVERIKQIRPITYQADDFGELFKADDKVREGFIAHELAEVIPSAVEGEKDAPNQIQSLRLDALCSVLVKAVQELITVIETQSQTISALDTRIQALESA